MILFIFRFMNFIYLNNFNVIFINIINEVKYFFNYGLYQFFIITNLILKFITYNIHFYFQE